MAAWGQSHDGLGAMPLFSLPLTIGTYLMGVWLQRRTRAAIANPVLIAIVLVGVTMSALHISYSAYFSGAQMLHFLLGPATVALAVPLARSVEAMRRSLWPMLAALMTGSIVGAVSGYGLVRWLGGSQVVALSMLPKSLTTPIAIGVSEGIGGIGSLTAVLAITAGILVAVTIKGTLRVLKIHDPAAIGLAAGTAGSGVGASQVIPEHALSAAFAGVAIGANGFVTAVMAPALAKLLRHW